MDKELLKRAHISLDMSGASSSKVLMWVVIGIVVGMVVIFLAVVAFIFIRSKTGSSYPYIPVPENAVRSRSLPELMGNLFMDMNESGDKYNVYRRRN